MGIIAGIHKSIGKEEARQRLASMLKVQAHRDPSGKVVAFASDDLAIGGVNHFDIISGRSDIQEQSIEDLSSSKQILSFVDGIVLNSAKLQEELLQAGFASISSHSAIVSASYLKWGLDFMNHLEGEFSCAIWDANEKRLILARDPYGHKPLHYYHDRDGLVFSSEIKGVLATGVVAEIDLINLSDFMTLNNIPYPGTIFKNIFQVEPGSLVIFDQNGLRVKRYWQHTITVDDSISFADALAQIEPAFKDAVAKRMFGENTYCFLSGGIDSSAIVSYATEISGKKVHAVSIGFEEEEENELEDAAIMAKHVGAEHYPLVVKPDSFFDILETLVFHHDVPFTDTSAYPTYFAGKVGADLTDIILTGDGPDQTMGGSSHYVFAVENDLFAERSGRRKMTNRVASQILDQIVSSPTPSLLSKVQRKLYRDSLSPIQAAYDLRSYFPDIVKKHLCDDWLWKVHCENSPYRHPEKWFFEARNTDDINKYLYADMSFYVPDDLMIKVDRMCMAHGLETLSPFQDLRLAEVVNKLPGSYKIHQQNGKIITKHLLKELCHKRFPDEILNKKKQGFGIPLEKWLRKDNGKIVKDILLDPHTLARQYFKKDALENMIQLFLSGKGDYFYPAPNCISGLLTFELWHRRYIDGNN